jgi:anthranilate synthase component 1
MFAIYLLTADPGGGIVFDSDPYDEWVETMNKLSANISTIKSAEKHYTRLQSNENGQTSSSNQEGLPSRPADKAHIDLAAG